MKIYKLIILFCAFSFIIYYNFFHSVPLEDNIVSEKAGCTNPNSEKYDPEATIDDGSCPPSCCTQQDKDPCLCRSESIGANCNIELNKIDNTINLKKIKTDRLSNDVKFHELIYSAYFENYYSKLMQISQITYMDYLFTNLYDNKNVEDNNSPQYLFFSAIEFISRSDYDRADKIRDKLSKMNVSIKDVDGKTEWEIL